MPEPPTPPPLPLPREGDTIERATRLVRDAFRAAGIDSPDLDARIIAAHDIGLDLTGLVREAQRALDRIQAERMAASARRRLAGEPIARIVGRQEFWGLWFDLGPDTLVPRPDTETIVDVALAIVDAAGRRHEPLAVADLGVGSGAILTALLQELPAAVGLGTDLSPGALAVARRNLAANGVAERAVLARATFADALAPSRFDLVVANPPYIASDEIAGLMREVAAHDPLLALDGGPDGLQAYRALVAPAHAALKPGGCLLLEIGHDQGDSVPRIVRAAGFERISVTRDLGGNDRIVRAFKS